MAAAQLYLTRHGKSAWGEPVPDRERALAPRGARAAQLIGRFLTDIGEAPDRVLTSNARRAHETATLASRAGGWDCGVVVVAELYGASAADLIDLVAQHGGIAERLVVVGHEPTLSQAVGMLCGRVQVRVPTAALARIDLDIERWRDAVPGSGELRWLVTPRLLKAAGRR